MKYQSLRFFIQINGLLGWIVIIGGALISVFWATSMGSLSGSPFAGFIAFLMGLFISVLLGLQIFAMGNIFQCFIDIEENTERTARLLRDLTSNPIFREASVRATGTEESSSSSFTYLCPNCPTFSRSDVITCPNCGTANPHNPVNKSKTTGVQASSASPMAGKNTSRCLRCGVGVNGDDKFCTSCGYAQS